LAKITLEILQTRRSSHKDLNAVFHLTNPCRGNWSSLVPAIQDKYPVQSIPLSEWLDELEGIKDPTDQEVREKPALKLLSFYRGLVGNDDMLSAEVSVEKAKQASKTMAALGPVSSAQMLNWVHQWNF